MSVVVCVCVSVLLLFCCDCSKLVSVISQSWIAVLMGVCVFQIEQIGTSLNNASPGKRETNLSTKLTTLNLLS